MESSNVLTALEELERWRSRKARLEERLAELQSRREALRTELERVKKELSAIDDALLEPHQSPRYLYTLPPFQGGR